MKINANRQRIGLSYWSRWLNAVQLANRSSAYIACFEYRTVHNGHVAYYAVAYEDCCRYSRLYT